MTSIGRKPVGEVIVDFLDGGSYLKQKLELHVLSIEERHIRASQAAAQSIVDGAQGRQVPVGDEDVKRLMDEFSLDRGEATRVLREAGGKLDDAIWKVIDA